MDTSRDRRVAGRADCGGEKVCASLLHTPLAFCGAAKARWFVMRNLTDTCELSNGRGRAIIFQTPPAFYARKLVELHY